MLLIWLDLIKPYICPFVKQIEKERSVLAAEAAAAEEEVAEEGEIGRTPVSAFHNSFYLNFHDLYCS